MRLTVLKLGLRALERGDTAGAADAFRAVITMTATEPESAPGPPELRAVRKKKLAALLDVSTRHVDALEKRFPREAILGSGLGKRYVVSLVFAALGREAPPILDAAAEEGRAYVRAKAKLKLVSGGG